MSHSFGAALIHHGVKKGDIIDVLLPNLPEYPIVMLGIWLAGGVVAPVSTMTTEGKWFTGVRDNLSMDNLNFFYYE